MTEEFIIDSYTMERGDGDKPATLVYETSLFQGIDKVTSNRTNTVDFPASANNLRAVSDCDLSNSGYPFLNHTATYKRDGQELFNGYAQLTKLTDSKMTFVFVWGNVTAFKTLMDYNLRDLDDDDLSVAWDVTGVQSTSRFDSNTDWGLGHRYPATGTPLYLPHPYLKVTDILTKAAAKSGVTFDGINKFSDLLIPLVTRNPLSGVATGAVKFNRGTLDSAGRLGFNSQYDTDYDEWVNSDYNFGKGDATKCKLVITNLEIVIVANDSNIREVDGIISIEDGEYPNTVLESTEDESYTITYDTVGGRDTATFELNGTVTFDNVSLADVNSIQIRLLQDLAPVSLYDCQITSCNISLQQYKSDGLVQIGDNFPLYHNLPDWTVSQLLKNVMKIKGVFAMPTDTGAYIYSNVNPVKFDPSDGYCSVTSFTIYHKYKLKTLSWTQQASPCSLGGYYYADYTIVVNPRIGTSLVGQSFGIRCEDIMGNVTVIPCYFDGDTVPPASGNIYPSHSDKCLEFLSVGDVKTLRNRGVDWTERMPGVPEETVYTYGDHAKANTIKYKEDEEKNEYEWDMLFDNSLLDESKDFASIEFSGTKQTAAGPVIPAYSLNDDGELEFNEDMSPRILCFESDSQGVHSSFATIAPDNLVEEVYVDYKAIMEKPKVLTVTVYMDTYALKDMRMDTPVYSRRTGRFYIIGKLTTQDETKCKVELIQI